MNRLAQLRNTRRYTLLGGNINPQAQTFYDRVLADSGNVDESLANLSNLLNQLSAAVPNFYSACKLAYAPHWGNKASAGTGGTAGNRAASKLYNFFGASGDSVQATAASQPLLLRHTGTNYAYLSGVAGNYFSTPNNTNNDLSGNFSIEAKITPSNLTGDKIIISKYRANVTDDQFIFFLSGNRLKLELVKGASDVTYQSTVAISFSANTTFFARVSRNSSTGEIKFFTSADGITYTQLGTTVTGLTGTLTVANRFLEIGAYASGVQVFLGEIYYIKIFKDDSFTTATQFFNPANFNRSVSQTSFTSSTGEVYTNNVSTATTGLKTLIVDKGLVVGNGTSYAMQAPSFAFNNTKITHYKVVRFFNNTVLSLSSSIGNNAGGANGFYIAKNEGSSNTIGTQIYGNVSNGRNYTNTNLLMQILTASGDTTLTNPETDLYAANIQQTQVSQYATGNNSSGINTTGFNLMANNNGASLWSNEVVFGELIFEGIHDTTTRTNVVNILKAYFNLP